LAAQTAKKADNKILLHTFGQKPWQLDIFLAFKWLFEFFSGIWQILGLFLQPP